MATVPTLKSMRMLGSGTTVSWWKELPSNNSTLSPGAAHLHRRQVSLPAARTHQDNPCSKPPIFAQNKPTAISRPRSSQPPAILDIPRATAINFRWVCSAELLYIRNSTPRRASSARLQRPNRRSMPEHFFICQRTNEQLNPYYLTQIICQH